MHAVAISIILMAGACGEPCHGDCGECVVPTYRPLHVWRSFWCGISKPCDCNCRQSNYWPLDYPPFRGAGPAATSGGGCASGLCGNNRGPYGPYGHFSGPRYDYVGGHGCGFGCGCTYDYRRGFDYPWGPQGAGPHGPGVITGPYIESTEEVITEDPANPQALPRSTPKAADPGVPEDQTRSRRPQTLTIPASAQSPLPRTTSRESKTFTIRRQNIPRGQVTPETLEPSVNE